MDKAEKEEEMIKEIFERVRKGLGLKKTDVRVFNEHTHYSEGKLTPLGVVISHTIFTSLEEFNSHSAEKSIALSGENLKLTMDEEKSI